MTHHTPAPWRYSPDETGAPVVGPDNVRICDMDCVDFYDIVDDADTGEGEAAVAEYEAQREANARLVTAAPKLLAACEGILASFAESVKTELGLDSFPALKAVQDAITEAKGA